MIWYCTGCSSASNFQFAKWSAINSFAVAIILPYLYLFFSCLSVMLGHGSVSHHFALPGYTELVSKPRH